VLEKERLRVFGRMPTLSSTRTSFSQCGFSRAVSKVARYHRERMPMKSEKSTEAGPFRLSLASSIIPHCHAACVEAALPASKRHLTC
jgi:hypothetical protein